MLLLRFYAAALTLALLSLSCAAPRDPPADVFRRIREASETGTPYQVVELASKALKKYPHSLRLRLTLARTEFSLGHFKETVATLEPVLKEPGDYFEVYRTLGLSKFYLGEFKEALPLLEKAYPYNTKDPELLKKLAYLHYYLGSGATALDLFDQRLENDPNDLEAFTARDALMSLTGRWPAAQMVWYTEPTAGLQICYPGGWEKERKTRLGPAGQIISVRFSGRVFETEGRFFPSGVLLLTVFHNATRHPLPQIMRGAFRRGEQDEDGNRWFYATKPGAEARFRAVSREPAEMVRFLVEDALRSLPDAWDLRVVDTAIERWSGIRGSATYAFGEIVGEDTLGNQIFGRSAGIYDPSADTFVSLVLYGPAHEKEPIRLISQGIFDLALFGGVPGIPPAPEQTVTEQEYRSRVQGFLQSGQTDRAITEAQKGIQVYPKSGELHVLLAQGHAGLWHLEEAAQELEKARGLGWSNFPTEHSLGSALLGLGRPAEAEQAFLRALEFKPKDAQATIGAGLAAYRQGESARAKEHFGRVADPGNPLGELAQSLSEAMEGLEREKEDPSGTWWYRLPYTDRRLFCVPGGWRTYELNEKDRFQAFFTAEPLETASEDFDTGMIYVRYEAASRRVGKLLKEDVKPQEVVDDFLTQTYQQLTDPQKVWQTLSPIFRWGVDRYGLAGYAYTHLSRRRIVRMLCYYEPGEDRLHVLTFRTTGSDLGPWESFVEACFHTADFSGSQKALGDKTYLKS